MVGTCIALEACARVSPQETALTEPSDRSLALGEPQPKHIDAAATEFAPDATLKALSGRAIDGLTEQQSRVAAEDLWVRIRHGFKILPTLAKSRRLHSRPKDFWFGLQQSYVDQVVQRAQPYLHRIVEEIERRDMPVEIALLPIVESQYQPHALSPVNAAGIWQLIPATGRRFGLKQNAWYDGRKDITASTSAALSYLNFLQRRFHGDWLKALAAYNCGEGLVDAAIEANLAAGRGTDFWSLHLPAETRAYVPRLLAIASVIADPERFNVKLRPIENRPYVAEVRVSGQIKLERIAKMAGLSLQELRALNPGFHGTATQPKAQSTLLLPLGNITRLREGVSQMPLAQQLAVAIQTPEPAATTTAQTRDTSGAGAAVASQQPAAVAALAGIDERHVVNASYSDSGSAIEALRSTALRPDSQWSEEGIFAARSSAHFIKTGLHEDLGLRPERSALRGRTGSEPTSSARYVRYRTREGDSLWLISQRFRVTVEQLCRWNSLTRGSPELAPGLILHIYANTNAV